MAVQSKVRFTLKLVGGMVGLLALLAGTERLYYAGSGGQKLRLYPNRKIVLVNRVDTGAGRRRAIWWKWGKRVKNSNITELLGRLQDGLGDILARPPVDPGVVSER